MLSDMAISAKKEYLYILAEAGNSFVILNRLLCVITIFKVFILYQIYTSIILSRLFFKVL